MAARRVMFSYTHDDKDHVHVIYNLVREDLGDEIDAWIDDVELVPGDDMIGQIADALNNADKVFLFVSSKSMRKSWVKREFRKVLMREINEDRDLIVPVLLDGPDVMPDFTEHKVWLDPRAKTREELVAEIRAAIEGKRDPAVLPVAENLKVTVEQFPFLPSNVAVVVFEAFGYAVPFSFHLYTKADIRQHWVLRGRPRPGPFSAVGNGLIDNTTAREFAMSFDSPRIEVGAPLSVVIVFDEGVDAPNALVPPGTE